ALAEHRDPREARLEPLEREPLEQRVLVVHRGAPFVVVVRGVQRVAVPEAAAEHGGRVERGAGGGGLGHAAGLAHGTDTRPPRPAGPGRGGTPCPGRGLGAARRAARRAAGHRAWRAPRQPPARSTSSAMPSRISVVPKSSASSSPWLAPSPASVNTPAATARA